MTKYRIRSFDKGADASAFHCGNLVLDNYIRRYASQDARRNVARIFIATPDGDPSQLAGFFTLSAGSVRCTELPEALAKKLPKYPVPVALLGRLAVATAYQGKGLGSILLADACRRVAQASSALAVVGISVDGKDEAALRFYRHFGFQSMPGLLSRLLLPTSAFRG
ncbi:MAG: GNAT family N-acetyltransferase [Burkholderiales bacterium]